VDSVAEALRVSGLDPARLILELTETVMLQDVQSALVTLRKLKNLGVLIALDDFGTGFSSLSYLLRFPFDRIKIDRAFIAGLEQEAQSVTVVGAIIDLCRALGMVTTAEGVETEAQFDILAQHGCDHVQGYLISRPMPVAALGAFLAAQIGSGQNSNSQAA
jgi:EAL domain-containing protein (putative c-di-GMP-specific phosphodiesterase class I)